VRGPVPGEIEGFGVRLRIVTDGFNHAGLTALLRNWRPGDRVRPRHTSRPRKVKEVLERLRVTGSDREQWPVLEVDGRIVWMKGVELEPESDLSVMATTLTDTMG